jgi:hypothetical protein
MHNLLLEKDEMIRQGSEREIIQALRLEQREKW